MHGNTIDDNIVLFLPQFDNYFSTNVMHLSVVFDNLIFVNLFVKNQNSYAHMQHLFSCHSDKPRMLM